MSDAADWFLERPGYPPPIHATQVHMPIRLIVCALELHISAPLLRYPVLTRIARHCTVFVGIMDWQPLCLGA
jgi:hypothetical protein